MGYLVFGMNFLVFGMKYFVFGMEYLVFGMEFLVFGMEYLVFGMEYLVFERWKMYFQLPVQCYAQRYQMFGHLQNGSSLSREPTFINTKAKHLEELGKSFK